MKKKVVAGLGLLGLAFSLGGDALACGDKLVIVGRGLRPKRRAASRASILVYAPPGGSLPAALGEGGLQANLERAGHRLSRVSTEEELRKALGAGGYDLVFADFAVAPRVEAEAGRVAAHPTVLPALYNPSPAELKAAATEFQCVIKSPGKEKDYLAVVDEAMATRNRQAGTGKVPPARADKAQ
ncbi:MAG TPA: hypothetical protein VGB87_06245 [Vicinamibacteria bacterium]